MTRPALLGLLVLAVGQAARPPSPPPAGAATAEQRTAARLEALRRDPAALRSFLFAFPKGADLHSHLGGAVYAETYIAWAAELPLCIDVRSRAYVESLETRGDQVVCREPATQRPSADALGDPALYRTMVDALSMRNHDISDGPGSDQFFDSFGRFQAIFRASQAGAGHIGRLLAEVVDRGGRQNVQYIELMIGMGDGRVDVAPEDAAWNGPADLAASRDRLLAAGLRDRVAPRRRWLDEAERAMRAAMACDTPTPAAGCDVVVRYLVFGLRAMPPRTVFSQLLLAFETAAADPRVVGVNLVQPEDWFVSRRDYDLHVRMFEELHRHYPQVNVALHAGELAFGQVPPADLGWHVRRAVESGVARRIGHAADVMHDPRADELLGDMARRGIAVEINLSSNDHVLGLRGAAHPLRSLLRAGVPVVLTTDDEGVSRSDLTHEYQRAVEEHGATYGELKRISRAGLAHAFLDEAEQRRLTIRLEEAFAAFERRYD